VSSEVMHAGTLRFPVMNLLSAGRGRLLQAVCPAQANTPEIGLFSADRLRCAEPAAADLPVVDELQVDVEVGGLQHPLHLLQVVA